MVNQKQLFSVILSLLLLLPASQAKAFGWKWDFKWDMTKAVVGSVVAAGVLYLGYKLIKPLFTTKANNTNNALPGNQQPEEPVRLQVDNNIEPQVINENNLDQIVPLPVEDGANNQQQLLDDNREVAQVQQPILVQEEIQPEAIEVNPQEEEDQHVGILAKLEELQRLNLTDEVENKNNGLQNELLMLETEEQDLEAQLPRLQKENEQLEQTILQQSQPIEPQQVSQQEVKELRLINLALRQKGNLEQEIEKLEKQLQELTNQSLENDQQ